MSYLDSIFDKSSFIYAKLLIDELDLKPQFGDYVYMANKKLALVLAPYRFVYPPQSERVTTTEVFDYSKYLLLPSIQRCIFLLKEKEIEFKIPNVNNGQWHFQFYHYLRPDLTYPLIATSFICGLYKGLLFMSNKTMVFKETPPMRVEMFKKLTIRKVEMKKVK